MRLWSAFHNLGRVLHTRRPPSFFVFSGNFPNNKGRPGFCMFLRKYLTSARLLKIEQKNFERIVILTFSSKGEEYYLIVELCKESNQCVSLTFK
jgi:predicted ribosome quality control (RQC) complex YloA/Tae2 family protein